VQRKKKRKEGREEKEEKHSTFTGMGDRTCLPLCETLVHAKTGIEGGPRRKKKEKGKRGQPRFFRPSPVRCLLDVNVF